MPIEQVIQLVIRGQRKAKQKLERMEKLAAKRIILRASKKAMTPVSRAAKQLVPKRSGKLKKSIKKKTKVFRRGTVVVRIFSNYPTSHLVELGTKPHKIRSKFGRLVSFTIRGKPITALAIDHPGAKPHPFLKPALDRNRSKALGIYSREVLAGIKREARRG